MINFTLLRTKDLSTARYVIKVVKFKYMELKDPIYHQVAKVLLTRHFHRKVGHANQCYF